MKFSISILFSLLIAFCTAQPVINVTPGGKVLKVTQGGKVIEAKLPVLPEGLVITHIMSAFVGFISNTDEYIAEARDKTGVNVFWLYGDYFDSARAMPFMDACARQGVKVIVSNSIGAIDYVNDVAVMPFRYSNLKYMIQLTYNHPATYRIGGKRVYCLYEYGGQFNPAYNVDYVPTGVSKDSVFLLANLRFEERLFSDNTWFGGLPYAKEVEGVRRAFINNPEIGGELDFGVDKLNNNLGYLGNLLLNINNIGEGARQAGRLGIVGINHQYASASYYSFGFDSTLAQIKAILALAKSKWPHGLSYTTANDYNEKTNMQPLPADGINGTCYIPPLSSGSDIGPQTGYPILDNSGVSRFILPWLNKFKSGDQTPVTFTLNEEQIFVWYMLHPINAAFIDSVPTYLKANRPANLYEGIPGATKTLQTWWEEQMYHGPRAGVAGDSNQSQHVRVRAIKSTMPPTYTDIKMACHLSAPAYLEIEVAGVTYRSTTLQNGPDGYWQIPQHLGTPKFRIVNPDGSLRKEFIGVQPITNSCWPGGWVPLIMEGTSKLILGKVLQISSGIYEQYARLGNVA